MLDDADPIETREWLAAIESVIRNEGADRARFILSKLAEKARRMGAEMTSSLTTPYCNTLSPEQEARMPGDLFMERRIRSLIRWNAMALVIRANLRHGDLGGHISSFSSSATLYDVGFNYFFHAGDESREADLIYIQGHTSPGIYARSFLEGRLSEEQMDKFRTEVDGGGLSSYPHPWLMPDYWQFPTVSMGLGPLQAIYQAHVMKYLHSRELSNKDGRKVWCFVGDGETDEPETLGSIALAGREKLDNLIFVVNCNLQRLDGPVRGNGKIIQELEGVFRGAGWNVIKVVWGRQWDTLFKKDLDGAMQRAMDEVVDGEMQNFVANGAAYTRKHFFGLYPELEKLAEELTDDDINQLNRGGHDPYKVYAAYHQAVHHKGQPTVILAQTIKGYGFGKSGEATNTTHSLKKLDVESLKAFRDRFGVPVSNDDIEQVPFYRPPADSPEVIYMKKRREAMGGFYPKRRKQSQPLTLPDVTIFSAQLEGTGEREISTTMAFVRMLSALTKDKRIGKRIVPIVPDEARTFGMEGMFRQLGIYTSEGQKYIPNDREQVMYYREDQAGQILEEGINEAGAMAAWMACATSYSTHDFPLIPFYIFYSMFGFQRIGDLAWAAGDMRCRGFLLGGTSGRTTLNGEGLQHQDGHSHVLAGTIPNCVAYDPAYACELAVIIQDGLRRMYQDNEDIYYYLTVMNEPYVQPALVKGSEDGIIKGMYLLERVDLEKPGKKQLSVQLLGSGALLNEVRAAARLLRDDFNIASDVWSVTSFNELARDGQYCHRWNRLNPEKKAKVPYVSQCLSEDRGPVVASSDYIKLYADQIRAFVPQHYIVLGTDGFGRSDTREKLRQFFEVDRYYVVISALYSLSQQGLMDSKTLLEAMRRYNIDRNCLSATQR